MREIYPFSLWILIPIISFVWTIIATRLLQTELKKRKSGTALLTTKYLKIWSYLCMLLAPIAGLSSALLYLPGFCYVMWFFGICAFYFQELFMGFFQLSRIYYCFSISKTYVSRGYANWVFFIMYTFGAISIICYTIANIITPGFIPSVCGINKKGERFVEYVVNSQRIEGISYTLSYSVILYYIWDFVTLLMYALKIRLFKKYETENPQIYARILSVLHRVLILTLFYEFMFLFLWIIRICALYFAQNPETVFMYVYYSVYAIANGVHAISYSYAVFLMLEHNTDEYIKFLECLHRTKLYCICCCCRHMVTDQLKVLNIDEKNVAEHVENNVVEATEYETHDISANHARMDVRPRTVSPDSGV